MELGPVPWSFAGAALVVALVIAADALRAGPGGRDLVEPPPWTDGPDLVPNRERASRPRRADLAALVEAGPIALVIAADAVELGRLTWSLPW